MNKAGRRKKNKKGGSKLNEVGGSEGQCNFIYIMMKILVKFFIH